MSNPAEKDNSPSSISPECDAYAQLHNGSTSSSEAGSSKSATPRIFQTMHVDVHENQRRFPIVGWTTSQLPSDTPNFSSAMHHYENQRKSQLFPSVAAFHEAFRAENRDSMYRGANVPVKILDLKLPEGYRWSGYWEIKFRHPKGVDSAGWRYASQIKSPDNLSVLFKKTQTPNCMVRRRTWTRMVKLASDETSSEASSMSVSNRTSEAAIELYLREKQDEMIFSERLKKDRAEALECGKEWTQEEELAAEESLRSFVQKSRSQHKKNAYAWLRNTSMNNPFQTTSTDLGVQAHEGSETISCPWNPFSVLGSHVANNVVASDDEVNTPQIMRAPSNLRSDGADMSSRILFFMHDESAQHENQGSGGGQQLSTKTSEEEPAATVSAFLFESPTEKDPQTCHSPNVIEEGTGNLDYVFSKFINNPGSEF